MHLAKHAPELGGWLIGRRRMRLSPEYRRDDPAAVLAETWNPQHLAGVCGQGSWLEAWAWMADLAPDNQTAS
ncbi:hypothetical protein ACX5K5_14315 [Glutamicibacter bergerei]